MGRVSPYTLLKNIASYSIKVHVLIKFQESRFHRGGGGSLKKKIPLGDPRMIKDRK